MKNVMFLGFFVMVFPSFFASIHSQVFLPFLDDFSSYNKGFNYSLWKQSSAFVNAGYQYMPPTLGVATLDILDASGRIYENANIYGFSADTLESVSIRLDSIYEPNTKKLALSDSIYLSFFVQPGGSMGNMWERIGSAPSVKDSIILQFYASNQNRWQTVWHLNGLSVEDIYNKDSTYFMYVLVPIKDTMYLNPDFRFRFINYGSLDDNPSYAYVSNADEWNIDYVYMNISRSYTDSVYRDLAFVEPAGSILKNYTSVPAKHFIGDYLKDTLDVKIANLYSSTLNSYYSYFVSDTLGNVLHSYNGGFENIVSYPTTHQFQSAQKHARPEFNFSFTPREWSKYIITHIVKEGVGQDNIHTNDTTIFVQNFSNYFSYDDGTSESGIGIEPTGKSMFAIGYKLLAQDTLYAVDIYFNEAYQSSNFKPFTISIYDASGSVSPLPNNVIYTTSKLTPEYKNLNHFVRYMLDEPLVLNSGTFFVCIQAQSSTYLNIGFDNNTDARGNMFEYRGSEWKNIFLKGSPMIRPYFGYKSVGFANMPLMHNDIKIYPNPAQNYFEVDGVINPDVEIMDMSGRVLLKSKDSLVDIATLHNGVYVVKVNNKIAKLVVAK